MLSQAKMKVNNFALSVDYVAFGIASERQFEGLPPRPGWVNNLDVVLSMIFTNFVARAICKVKGHDSEDVGYGTPETGCIHVVCNRCDRTLGHATLY